jgi:hypothetical protein
MTSRRKKRRRKIYQKRNERGREINCWRGRKRKFKLSKIKSIYW